MAGLGEEHATIAVVARRHRLEWFRSQEIALLGRGDAEAAKEHLVRCAGIARVVLVALPFQVLDPVDLGSIGVEFIELFGHWEAEDRQAARLIPEGFEFGLQRMADLREPDVAGGVSILVFCHRVGWHDVANLVGEDVPSGAGGDCLPDQDSVVDMGILMVLIRGKRDREVAAVEHIVAPKLDLPLTVLVIVPEILPEDVASVGRRAGAGGGDQDVAFAGTQIPHVEQVTDRPGDQIAGQVHIVGQTPGAFDFTLIENERLFVVDNADCFQVVLADTWPGAEVFRPEQLGAIERRQVDSPVSGSLRHQDRVVTGGDVFNPETVAGRLVDFDPGDPVASNR